MGAVHPAAALQATDAGKTITALSLIDGLVYAGYGDYDSNTGPIHVESVDATDPVGAWTDHVTVDTEQVSAIRPASSGRVFVPHLDPRQSGHAGYAERQANGTWVDRPGQIAATGAIHVFDMVEFAGRLWACGAAEVQPTPTSDGQAVVWHSTDNGATWVESFRDPHLDPVSRFYGFLIVGDALFVFNRMGLGSFVWTVADDWQTAGVQVLPSDVEGGPGKAWADGWLAPLTVMVGPATNQLYYFDGTATATRIAPGLDVTAWDVAGDGSLVVATSDRRLHRASAAAPGTFVAGDQFEYAGYALAVLPGDTQAVVGLPTSRLLLVDVPALT